MHPDIRALSELWEVDEEMDQIRSDLESLADQIRVEATRLQSLKEELSALESRIEENQKETRTVHRRCQDYIKKRDKTRAMIDEGRAPDFFVAQKQFDQCAAIVDELEFEELELMESREEMELLRRGLEHKLAEQSDVLQSASSAQSTQRPGKVARYRELQPLRVERLGGVQRFLHAAYDSLRERKKIPLVHLVGSNCSQCNIGAPPQMVLEVTKGKRAHPCRGCGAWLLPALEPDDEPG